MKLPQGRNQKFLWYIIIPFIASTIFGIIFFMMSSERNVLTLIPYIILMTILISIYGYAFDDAIRKSNREISLLDIKNHSSIGIFSIILPIVAILSILIRIIFQNRRRINDSRI